MTGAELLALARHSWRSPSDRDLALHFAAALRLLLSQLTDGQCTEVRNVLQCMLTQDMIRRSVRNDYSNLQARTNS